MRYYGIKHKIRNEDLTYAYAKTTSKIKSILPGKRRKYWRQNHDLIYKNDYAFSRVSNAVPDGKFLRLDQIVTSDLISREDIEKLQKGLRRLLIKYRAGNRFIIAPAEGLDEIYAKIERMDSTLLSWYEGIQCGVFTFQDRQLSKTIDHFTVDVKNVNTSYLSVEFRIFLTKEKQKELEEFSESDYHEFRGYAHKFLSSKKDGGAFSSYTVVHYSDEDTKADKIYEWISCVQWEFYEEMRRFIPSVLHSQGIEPPRIEVYYTDIDYHDDNRAFWYSIGIADCNGQFIAERQKMFFDVGRSGRYEKENTDSRLIYIIKDDGIEAGRFKSVRDEVYFHMKEYARHYFRFLFLDIMARQAGKTVVEYKRHIDRVKLNKNKLSRLLKLRYHFERAIDSYARYARDDIWKRSIDELSREVYGESNEILAKITRPFATTYNNLAEGAISGSKKIDSVIETLRTDFDDKEQVLQHLSDYENSNKNWRLNIIMLLITAITLFFVVFPETTEWAADALRSIWQWIIGRFGK